MITAIVGAITFLTRLPLGRVVSRPFDLAASVGWFPAVGLLVGAVVGTVHASMTGLVGPLPAAAVAVTSGILITGAFHEDGLGDTADGFGGGWSPEERLEIMTDSRQGTYGVAAIACSIAIRVAAVSVLAGVDAVVVVTAAHVLGRAGGVVALGAGRPVRSGGLGAGAAPPDRSRVVTIGAVWTAFAGIGVGVALGPIAGAAAVVATAGLTGATVALARAKIGGVTGDVLGAVEQVCEAAVLVTLAGFVGS